MMRAGKSIRFKLIAWISVLFAVMGVFIYAPLSYILPQKIISQILKRDIEIAKYVSEQAKEYLLLDDKLALSLLLRESLQRLEDAQYLFLQGPDGRILSHTFARGFPRGLLSFNRAAESSYSVKEFLKAGKRIYDIAIPILQGEIGTLHLGVSLESGKKDIVDVTRINYYVASVILVVLGIGICVFLAMGLLFSRQIIKLKNFATEVGGGHFDTRLDTSSGDEIGALTLAFNEMAKNLKEKIREIKRLSTIEERSRIAFDLHDGCAQNMVSILKRIELCEKLINIDSAAALKELRFLEADMKEILNKTRQVIHDLKSRDADKPGLSQRLASYLKDYERINNIAVALDVSGSLDNIPAEKTDSLFYIISEALNNVRKHSLAKNVSLSIKPQDRRSVKITIQDDGRGFDVDAERTSGARQGKYGLASMQQRADSLGGRLTICSEPDKGSRVILELPLGYGT